MSKKKINFSCSGCGFDCEKEQQLIDHCKDHHKHEPLVLFNAIGKFVNLEHATIAYKQLQKDLVLSNNTNRQLAQDNKAQAAEITRLSKAINAYNDASLSITSTLNLLSHALEPLRTPTQNGSH